MTTLRIIPCLDVHNGNVVKGVNFKNIKDVGDPVYFAQKYYEDGADELVFLDISASHEKRATMLDIVQKVAQKVFIPLTVGGGVRNCKDVDALLSAGADKVGINTAAIERPDVIQEISDRFGKQILVLSVDAKRIPLTLERTESNDGTQAIATDDDTECSGKVQPKHKYAVTTHGGRKTHDLDALEWIQIATALGIGEVLLNSMDADGMQTGYDIEMTRDAREVTTVPLIASGGAGTYQDFVDACPTADALLAASVFHYDTLKIFFLKEVLRKKGFSIR